VSLERVVCWWNILACEYAIHTTVFCSRISPILWWGEVSPISLYHHVWRQKGWLQRSVYSTTRPVACRASCQEHSCVADILNPDSGCWAAWMFVPLDMVTNQSSMNMYKLIHLLHVKAWNVNIQWCIILTPAKKYQKVQAVITDCWQQLTEGKISAKEVLKRCALVNGPI